VKLLRFLEEHRFEPVGGGATITVDARIIAATNRDLDSDVRAGRFREDLFFRLNVLEVRLPPLRDRLEDLRALVDHVLAGLSARHHRGPLMLAPEARAALAAYRWPGNVRELVNVLERAIVLSRGDVLRAEDLPDRLLAPEAAPVAATAATRLSLEDVERRHIEAVLADSGTLEEAAARLGINATTLWRKRRRWGIE
jgi:two-component system, NtrC family, response regulator AlgB